MSGVEIRCQACGEEAFLLREPVYDGFTRTGESLKCSHCGHQFDSEDEIDFKEKKKISIFTEEDKSKNPDVFESDELTMCHRCAHYVVNPFMQWCDRHRKEVAATDTCPQFEQQSEKSDSIL